MTDEDIPTPKVAGHKQIQKEDLAVRITATLENAGYLYDSITFAEREVVPLYKGELGKLDEYTTNLYSVKNPIVQRVWKRKIKEIHKAYKEAHVEVNKRVDPEIYRNFLDEFYMLWCATADQLDETHWNKKEDPKKLEQFFDDNRKYGLFQPSKALELYIMYTKVLSNAGIRDLKTKKVPAGEDI